MSERLAAGRSSIGIAVVVGGLLITAFLAMRYHTQSPDTPRGMTEKDTEPKGEIENPSVDTSRMDHEDLYELGVSYIDSFRDSGRPEDIKKAIEYLSLALDLTPDDHPDLWCRHAALGASYEAGYRALGQAENLEKLIEHNSRALALAPDNHPDLPDRHAALGTSYTHRYRRLGQLEDLEDSIEQFFQALTLTADDHPSLPERHATLGVSYGDRYRRLGQTDDLEKSIEHDSHALALTPDGHSSLPSRHANLAMSYRDKYRRLGQLDDLEEAISHNFRAIELTPDDHPFLSDRHADIAVSYNDRFRRLGQVEDLDESTKHLTHALALTPDGHPSLSDRHANLGVAYGDRFRRLGQLEDLDKSTEHYTSALALAPDDHPNLSFQHAALGTSYSDRYRRLGQLDDLDKSTEHLTRAFELTPEGHPSLSDRHIALGVAYSDRHRRLGQIEDLEKSIEHRSHALALTADDHPSLLLRHAALGVAYSDLYRRLGQLDDLERSIEHHTRALALTPKGHPFLPNRHAALGVSYGDRYRRLGQVGDLEKSHEHRSRALALTPSDHPSLSDRNANLGVSYGDRYRRLNQPDDLEKSIEHFSRALELAPENHPDLSNRHTNLGLSYEDRYRRLGQVADLEASTEHYTRALELTPEAHPSLSDRHANLGVCYEDRYRSLGQVEDLDKAIKYSSRALELTPEDHPRLPSRHFNQGVTYWHQYQHTGDSSYATHTLEAYRNASQIFTGSPRVRFQNARRWASLALTQSSLTPIEAYQTAIDLLPQFIWLGATTQQRYQDLVTIENLAVGAASAAIIHSEYKLALEWLEHARCVVWNQTLMLRSPVDELHSSHPDLAARLQAIAKQLHDASSTSYTSQSPTSDSVDWEQIGLQRRRLAKEYEEILTKTRMLPGFEDFLLPVKADRLVRAARYGPIVVINCHEDQCDALLILPGQEKIQHVSLPGFTQSKAKSAQSKLHASLRRKGLRERGVGTRKAPGQKESIASALLSLWIDVVKPVLAFLGYLDNTSEDELPHITWCPTGALSFLPLHAAGDYDQPRSRVFDYVVSSYIPTLASLLSSSPNSWDRTLRLLAIGQEHTPGHSPLPGTSRELATLKAYALNKAQYSQITNDQATMADVLDAMEKHDWVHLACHAHQNIHDPTKSGFFLHDGTLELSTINQQSFRNKGLAFLSACQTAAGDEDLPDEAIHLASGMLMAGYPSVIATMWSVVDEDAPFVAEKVYVQLMEDGRVGNGEVGRALHNAVAGLREKVGEKEFSRWVPYIHIGS